MPMLVGFTVVLMLLIVYVLFWPVSPKPVGRFVAPDAPEMSGPYKSNQRLRHVERIGDGYCISPESIAIDAERNMLSGMADGRIMRFRAGDGKAELVVNTGGRPLGLAVDAAGNLIVADSKKGLLAVTSEGGIQVLAREAGGRAIRYANDLDIASDGTIYFSDFQYYEHKDPFLDIIDGRPLTRLLAYHPNTRSTSVVLEGLYAANGVALGPGDAYVLVCEFHAYRVRRHWLTGPRKGQTDMFIENLPGTPDNITFNGRDTFWLALYGPRNSVVSTLQANPWMRAILMRLPSFLIPSAEPAPYGFVLGLNLEGEVVHNYQDPGGKVTSHVTSACEYEGALYLGSIGDTAIKKLSLPASDTGVLNSAPMVQAAG